MRCIVKREKEKVINLGKEKVKIESRVEEKGCV